MSDMVSLHGACAARVAGEKGMVGVLEANPQ
jgi:hypothetical protein